MTKLDLSILQDNIRRLETAAAALTTVHVTDQMTMQAWDAVLEARSRIAASIGSLETLSEWHGFAGTAD